MPLAMLLSQTASPLACGRKAISADIKLFQHRMASRSGAASVQTNRDANPIFVGEGDIEAAQELIEQAEEGELFLYPGNQHYYADNSFHPSDAKANTLAPQRVLAFLAAS